MELVRAIHLADARVKELNEEIQRLDRVKLAAAETLRRYRDEWHFRQLRKEADARQAL